MNAPLQVWVGSTDMVYMLREIGGWHVGCLNEREAAAAVQHAKDNGWITTRMHYAPAFPEGSEAYELTDAGLEQLRRWNPLTAGGADKMRNWYRARLKEWRRNHEMDG